jgi:serine/threonine protein kinase/tetratricopeptide (TPR) repeat protein
MIGKTISHYRVTAELGRGGMGAVYQAEDTRLHRTVALKFLPAELTEDADARTRFVHEAQAASSLKHHHIGTIHDIDQSGDGRVFMCMDLYEGGSLKDRIAAGALDVDDALRLAAQVADGLSAAHEAGIVHRDIKPANILLTARGEAVIADFGLAKLSGRTQVTKTGTTVGTAAFMSPEQTQGATVDHRSDTWSLGVVLYQMLTGKLPFQGDHDAALAYGIVNADPPPLSVHRADVPSDVQPIIDKCLAKNPADRYQSAAELRDEIRAVVPAAPSSGGTQTVKNGQRKRNLALGVASILFGIAVVVIAVRFLVPESVVVPNGKPRLAVLPFDNLGTPEDEYFADGMTDELISRLGHINSLTVISRTSVMGYKGTGKSISEIADELAVDAVVEGSVLLIGGRVRITTRLIDARNDDLKWSNTYERPTTDIFVTQSNVALSVVDGLKATLTPQEAERLETPGTENVEAYNLYLKGSYFANKHTEEGFHTAIEYYEQAIAIDPHFAQPYFGLAGCYRSLPIYGHMAPEEALPIARRYAQKALDIDPNSASALYSLVRLRELDADWDIEEIENGFRRVIELYPSHVNAHGSYGFWLMRMNRCDEAAEEMKRSRELSPLNTLIHQNSGEVLYYCRRYEESIKASRLAIELDPDHLQAHLFLGLALFATGKREEAVTEVNRSRSSSPDVATWIGAAYGSMGMRDEALAVLNESLESIEEKWVSRFGIAVTYFSLGHNDEGFEWLQRAYDDRDPRLGYLGMHPAFDNVKSDPRYLKWCDRLQLNCKN